MITRRTFILGSAVVTGGIAVGYYAGTRPEPTTAKLPDTIPLEPGQVSITPYVVVDQHGIALPESGGWRALGGYRARHEGDGTGVCRNSSPRKDE